jgi:hypothetical protein
MPGEPSTPNFMPLMITPQSGKHAERKHLMSQPAKDICLNLAEQLPFMEQKPEK